MKSLDPFLLDISCIECLLFSYFYVRTKIHGKNKTKIADNILDCFNLSKSSALFGLKTERKMSF